MQFVTQSDKKISRLSGFDLSLARRTSQRLRALALVFGDPSQHAILVCFQSTRAGVHPDGLWSFGRVLEADEAGPKVWISLRALKGGLAGGRRIDVGTAHRAVVGFGHHGVLSRLACNGSSKDVGKTWSVLETILRSPRQVTTLRILDFGLDARLRDSRPLGDFSARAIEAADLSGEPGYPKECRLLEVMNELS